ncbi:hypothetical protein MHW47_09545 [Streptomyces sp. OfavH-34-F]|uniref:hypothetical protein n=1 Tax=Streptomyces sp. OfavH-34-F TaxID=2917760 RepID=UPI001EF1ACBF|nr:hypothetical protein [Streptomyces sp. OfavH-34-F]MCG7524680.1 hypothetical protein [Streptomyces sp. OfavH-34-F]
MSHPFDALVIRHTLRLPAPTGPAGQGEAAARQFDTALMSVGFKLSGGALDHLSALCAKTVTETARHTLDIVREMVGDHVRHNSYFIDFPAHVPDTFDFWWRCVADALLDETARPGTLKQLSEGAVDLLTLPAYGRYQHTYAELLAVHDELTEAAGDRLTVLHLGASPDEEASALYLALAGSTTPLSEEHLGDLGMLAAHCVDGPQPETLPVRENRAVVNRARLTAGREPLLDTVTDVLRLACALSDGDVTLTAPTRFRSFSRPVRRALLAGLDALVAAAPAKLADVAAHREEFKRLGERLHPHEYPGHPYAAEVFAVARGEKAARTLGSRVEEALAAGDVPGAAALLTAAPGMLMRALDRLLRSCRTDEEREAVAAAAVRVAPQVSGRVLLSVREHLQNRGEVPDGGRFFVNRRARAWVTGDTRGPIPGAVRDRLVAALDAEVARRLPETGRLLIDPDVFDVALPLSGKATSGGFGVLPRGSLTPVDGELLRFFVYWKQARRDTDFDLSALMLDYKYRTVCWLSYTALTEIGGEHSGDVTEAPEGASEFINLRLDRVRGDFVVPQVNIFSGEGFETVEESFFGFMTRDAEQAGRPFEPRTVRMKSELRGPGAVALPLAFLRGPDGRWRARWLHLYLAGEPHANRVEGNRVTVASLLRGIVEREYLTVGHLAALLEGRGTEVTLWDGGAAPDEPVTYIGLARPDGLHPDSVVVTPENLRDLIPA